MTIFAGLRLEVNPSTVSATCSLLPCGGGLGRGVSSESRGRGGPPPPPPPPPAGRGASYRVIDAVAAHGLIDLDTRGVAEVVVKRATRTISVRDIETAIARAIASRFPAADPKNLTVTFERETRALNLEPSVSA